MTEIEIHRPAAEAELHAQMDYARAVAVSNLLPQDYRNKPENVLIAMGLGQSMGLSPAESLYRISVIQGKPTASAELIAASVRKAGHILRVVGDDTTCTATIIRKDDPTFEHSVTRDVDWAQRMGLASKDNYKKQRGTMLQWRAITAVARLACPEALYGVAYTPDEMFDMAPEPKASSGHERLSAALAQPPADDTSGADTTLAAEYTDPVNQTDEPILLNTSGKLAKALYATLRDKGIDKDGATALYADVTGREVTSSKELTEDEARAVLKELDSWEKPVEAEVVEDYDPTTETGFGQAGA